MYFQCWQYFLLWLFDGNETSLHRGKAFGIVLLVNKLKFRPIVVTYGLRKKKDMDKASSNCPIITFISELEHLMKMFERF